MSPASGVVVFLSDYGLDDEFVGVCHGVIERLAPGTRVIDLTHAVPRQNISRGALILSQAVSYMPDEAVFLAIVDPEVGSPRAAIAVETRTGAMLVGPDNGVLSLAWEALGGAVRAVEITSDEVILERVSKTFHGRDIFAPAAAHLAAKRDLTALGPEVAVERLDRVSVPQPGVESGRIDCEVIGVDRYGNLQLNVGREDLTQAVLGPALMISGRWIPQVGTFADAPGQELAALWDSSGKLALFVTGGSAAEAMHLRLGSRVVIETPA